MITLWIRNWMAVEGYIATSVGDGHQYYDNYDTFVDIGVGVIFTFSW